MLFDYTVLNRAFYLLLGASHIGDEAIDLLDGVHDGDHVVDDGAAGGEDTGNVIEQGADILEHLPAGGFTTNQIGHLLCINGCVIGGHFEFICLLYTSPSPRDA